MSLLRTGLQRITFNRTVFLTFRTHLRRVGSDGGAKWVKCIKGVKGVK
jgi:hypothetical protein